MDRFVADGLTAGRPIVYSESGRPREVLEYHYHFWTEPPTILLRDQLVVYLRAAKVADTVVTPEHRVEPDYEARGQDQAPGAGQRQAAGRRGRAGAGAEKERRRPNPFPGHYRIEAEAKTGTVAAAVDALNSALGSSTPDSPTTYRDSEPPPESERSMTVKSKNITTVAHRVTKGGQMARQRA